MQVLVQPVEVVLPLLMRVGVVGDSQQREDVGPRVFQRRIEYREASRNLLPPAPLIILGADLEIVSEQLDQRQVRRSLAM
jgi:hypothetical protein